MVLPRRVSAPRRRRRSALNRRDLAVHRADRQRRRSRGGGPALSRRRRAVASSWRPASASPADSNRPASPALQARGESCVMETGERCRSTTRPGVRRGSRRGDGASGGWRRAVAEEVAHVSDPAGGTGQLLLAALGQAIGEVAADGGGSGLRPGGQHHRLIERREPAKSPPGEQASYQVPWSQELRYSTWSSDSSSIRTPIESSFRRAISLSICSGTP
jgi:hypothetical protein